MDLLLAERLLLISIDPRTGKPHSYPGMALSPALSGALLVDVLQRGAARMEGDRIIPVCPTGDPLLDQTLSTLASNRRTRTLTYWVRNLFDRRRDLLDRLVQRGLLAEQREKVLGLFPKTRYMLIAPAAYEETAAPLRQVLLGQTWSIPFQAGVLAALVGVTGLASFVVPPPFQPEADQRARGMAKGDPAAQAVTAAIREMQAGAAFAAGTMMMVSAAH